MMAVSNDYLKFNFDSFSGLLSKGIGSGDGERVAKMLLSEFGSVENIMAARHADLAEICGERGASFIKTLAAIYSRRITDRFAFGKKHTRAEIAEYLIGLYIPCSVETVYMLMKDKSEAVIGCKMLSEGTVNTSELIPRKLLEAAISARAQSVILAHNHPFGSPVASEDDVAFTSRISAVASMAGITLEYHVVVAGIGCDVIELPRA